MLDRDNEKRLGNTLQILHSIDWFASVGKPIDKLNSQVFSWEEADECCSQLAWRNLLITTHNEMGKFVIPCLEDRANTWNAAALEIRKVALPLIDNVIQNHIASHNFSKSITDSITWTLLHIAMNLYYGDIYKSSFYANLADCYVNGHFPCGWVQEYPEGNLIIY